MMCFYDEQKILMAHGHNAGLVNKYFLQFFIPLIYFIYFVFYLFCFSVLILNFKKLI